MSRLGYETVNEMLLLGIVSDEVLILGPDQLKALDCQVIERDSTPARGYDLESGHARLIEDDDAWVPPSAAETTRLVKPSPNRGGPGLILCCTRPARQVRLVRNQDSC